MDTGENKPRWASCVCEWTAYVHSVFVSICVATLVLCGDLDRRTKISQSQWFSRLSPNPSCVSCAQLTQTLSGHRNTRQIEPVTWTWQETEEHVFRSTTKSPFLIISHESFLFLSENGPTSAKGKQTSKSGENSESVLTAVYVEVTDSSQVKSIWHGFTAFLTVDLVSI